MESDIDAWERAGASVFVCSAQGRRASQERARVHTFDAARASGITAVAFATATPSAFVRALRHRH